MPCRSGLQSRAVEGRESMLKSILCEMRASLLIGCNGDDFADIFASALFHLLGFASPVFERFVDSGIPQPEADPTLRRNSKSPTRSEAHCNSVNS